MSITVWSSEIKCAYIWSTALKEIYVWTTKVRPTFPAWPYYVNALVIWAWWPWWPVSSCCYNGYYISGWWWSWAVCCYSSLQIKATASVIVWTPAAPSSSQVRSGASYLMSKNWYCEARWGTNYSECGSTAAQDKLYWWESWSGCPWWNNIELYSGRRMAWSGWGWAWWCWCPAIYISCKCTCWGNWWAWLCWYWGGWAWWGSHWNWTATCWWGQVNANATKYWWGGWWACLSRCSSHKWFCWCQWMVQICYLTNWGCWFCTATWWTITTSWNYKIHTFTSNWTFTITW